MYPISSYRAEIIILSAATAAAIGVILLLALW